MGTVAGPEVCLYSRSRFLRSCDILTTSEVSQLFQGINNGSGSPYLTFTVQAACFVAVVFYLPGYLGRTSDTALRSWPCCSPSLAAARHVGRHGHACLYPSKHSLHPCTCLCPAGCRFCSPWQRTGSFLRLSQLLHLSSLSYLLECSLLLISVVCLFSSSLVTDK